MTIKELKELIAHMKDDDLVYVCGEHEIDVVKEHWLNDIRDDEGVRREVIVLSMQNKKGEIK